MEMHFYVLREGTASDTHCAAMSVAHLGDGTKTWEQCMEGLKGLRVFHGEHTGTHISSKLIGVLNASGELCCGFRWAIQILLQKNNHTLPLKWDRS